MGSDGIFIGTAGVYHVMSELAFRYFHAAATHGNAPGFDILVCSRDAEQSIAIQVKSSHGAARNGKQGPFLDFPLSYKAGKMNRETVFFAFVDFGVPQNQKPDVYLVPSPAVHQACEPWIDKYEGKMVRFKPEIEWMKDFKNNWNQFERLGIVADSPINRDEAESLEVAESIPLKSLETKLT